MRPQLVSLPQARHHACMICLCLEALLRMLSNGPSKENKNSTRRPVLLGWSLF